jgi:hypothetical protein
MKTRDIFRYSLAALIVVGFFALLYLIINISIPIDNKDVLNITIGALIGAFTGVVSYFFGSSSGSARKDEIINDKINTPL